MSAKVEEVIAADDRVVARATITGTHSCIDIMRCAGGRIVEHLGEGDLGMMQQLGAFPTPSTVA
jgi:hypothetical protein